MLPGADSREELPTWLVLGAHGEAVVSVIRQARQLTDQQAKTIAALDPSDEQRLVSHVWDSWLSLGRGGSPVGIGLVEVDHAITQAARATGLPLFDWDHGGRVEVIADPAWIQAGRAANAAALAVGAPDILGAHDSQRMASRWARVVDQH